MQTADAINADSNVPDCNARAHEAAIGHSVFHILPTVENVVPPAVEEWPSGLDDDMLPWNEIDLEHFWNSDDSMLLQIALERLGGLIG
jgi:hypothetical protein